MVKYKLEQQIFSYKIIMRKGNHVSRGKKVSPKVSCVRVPATSTTFEQVREVILCGSFLGNKYA
jgi:hypothetical protein